MKEVVLVSPEALERFVRESNEIERIVRDPTPLELAFTRKVLESELLTSGLFQEFVTVCQPGALLRKRAGMNVQVGGYIAPEGGPRIEIELKNLLVRAQKNQYTPFQAYQEYERLHPFQDGNGRSGRVLWAWLLLRSRYAGWFEELGFLKAFHYQTFPFYRLVIRDEY